MSIRPRKSAHSFLLLAVTGAVFQSYSGYRVGDAKGRLVYVANALDAYK